MKQRIEVLVLVMVLLAALFLTSCGQSGPRVAFLLYDGEDTFISELMERLQQNIPAGLNYEVREAGNSQAKQNQQILELLEEGTELLVINAVDRLACSSIVEKCTRAGVKVIFFNREPLEDAMNGGSEVFYVGADADSLGKKQADLVAELFGPFFGTSWDRNDDGVVQLVILKGEQGHQDAEKRTDNCVARLEELGYEVEVLATKAANWVRRQGHDTMQQLYAEYGKQIELVFSNNDDMALGAIDYLLETGVFNNRGNPLAQPFAIIGVDGTAVGLKAVEEGTLYGTVLNDSATQADAILELVDYLMNGRDMASFPYEITGGHYVYIDGGAINRINVGQFVD